MNHNRKKEVEEAKARHPIDGLNSLKYRVLSREKKKTFTSILVDFKPGEVKIS